MTISRDKLLAAFNTALLELDDPSPNGGIERSYVDWPPFLAGEMEDVKWYLEGMWPVGRQMHIHAPRKSGKSLFMLYAAVKMAQGIDPITGAAGTTYVPGYMDYEMTHQDIRERLLDMRMTASDLVNLRYWIIPRLPPLDTAQGGRQLLAWLVDAGCDCVILDTFARVVEGSENDNDTYRNFYLHTGMPLKQAGIGLSRTDHVGHDSSRSRGASAKMDDVDVVWSLTAKDGGIKLDCKFSRIVVPYPGMIIELSKDDDPLAFRPGLALWSTEALAKAKELDALAIAPSLSVRKTKDALKALGREIGTATVLQDAIRYRKQRTIV